jgi:hypothetical protein
VWNEVFHLPVRSLETGFLTAKVFDFDRVSKDDLVGMVEFEIRKLEYGKVVDSWHRLGSSGSELHLVMHLAGPGCVSWESRPFIPKRLKFEVTANDLRSENCYLNVRLSDDWFCHHSLFGRTLYERFNFLLCSPSRDFLEVQVCEHFVKKADVEVSEVFRIPVSKFVSENGTTSVINMKTGGIIRVSGVVTDREGVEGGLGLSACEQHQLHVQILDNARIGTFDDGSYIKCKFPKRKQKQFSRIALAFRGWNSAFSLDVKSANGEFVKFTLIRYKRNSKDHKLGTGLVSLTSVGFGGVLDEWVTIKSYKKLEDLGQIHIRLNFAGPLSEPFVVAPFVPTQLHVIVIEALNIPKMDIGSKTDAFCRVRLSSDVFWSQTRVIEDSLTPQWCESLDFYILNLNLKDLKIEFVIVEKNIRQDKEFGRLALNIGDLKIGVVSNGWYDVSGSHKNMKLNVALQLIPAGGAVVQASDVIKDAVPLEYLAKS